MDWNVEKGQQGKQLMSSGHYEEFIAFLEMKMSQIDTEKHENPQISHFSKILCKFPQTYWRTCELERWKGAKSKECAVQ